MGAINLGLAQRISSGKIATFFLNLAGVVKFAFAVRRNDVVILQYPIKNTSRLYAWQHGYREPKPWHLCTTSALVAGVKYP